MTHVYEIDVIMYLTYQIRVFIAQCKLMDFPVRMHKTNTLFIIA